MCHWIVFVKDTTIGYMDLSTNSIVLNALLPWAINIFSPNFTSREGLGVHVLYTLFSSFLWPQFQPVTSRWPHLSSLETNGSLRQQNMLIEVVFIICGLRDIVTDRFYGRQVFLFHNHVNVKRRRSFCISEGNEPWQHIFVILHFNLLRLYTLNPSISATILFFSIVLRLVFFLYHFWNCMSMK